ncbi:hypothetical protein L1887_32238 [Cichorium endivia]|nr:hypothetical protein L1887_32238 [Cichorium endivia]
MMNVIALQHNRLTGPIPRTLGDLAMLERLDLSFNRLLGTIPINIARATQLELFDVQNNSLSGFSFNLEEIESATRYFSDANVLGKSKFSAVYKGVLRDRSC